MSYSKAIMLKPSIFLSLAIVLSGCQGMRAVPNSAERTDIRVIYTDLNPVFKASSPSMPSQSNIALVSVRSVVENFASDNDLKLIELPGDSVALDSDIVRPTSEVNSFQDLSEALSGAATVNSVIIDESSHAIRVVAQGAYDE
ncbi:hypothetical protein OAS86_02230 [Gammaproteobacteria bacterium]|nr:hypothetical protein [Gammaproteobacteria bacterium]